MRKRKNVVTSMVIAMAMATMINGNIVSVQKVKAEPITEISSTEQEKATVGTDEKTTETDTQATPVYEFVIVDGVLTEYNGDGSVVVIPDGVVKIGAKVFENKEIEEIVLPKSLQVIGDKAFNGCYKLEKIDLPKSLLHIGKRAFANCTSLKKITVPAKVKKIGKYAFEECVDLKKSVIKGKITKISEGMFNGCWELKSVKVPTTVKTIGKAGFAHCYSLKKVSGLKNVTTVGDSAFFSCESYKAKIGNKVTTIGKKAYYFCRNSKIVVPASVKKVGEGAFEGIKKIVNKNGIICSTVKNLEADITGGAKKGRYIKADWKKVSVADGYQVRITYWHSLCGLEQDEVKKINTEDTKIKIKISNKLYQKLYHNQYANQPGGDPDSWEPPISVEVRPYEYENGKKVYGIWQMVDIW